MSKSQETLIERNTERMRDLIHYYCDDAVDVHDHASLVYQELGIHNFPKMAIRHEILRMYPRTLTDMHNTPEYNGFMHDRLDPNNLILDGEINRSRRLKHYGSYGMDGSTYAESIEDDRAFIGISGYPGYIREDLLEALDVVEERFEKTGRLNEMIG